MEAGLDRRRDSDAPRLHLESAWAQRLHRITGRLSSGLRPIVCCPRQASWIRRSAAAPLTLLVMVPRASAAVGPAGTASDATANVQEVSVIELQPVPLAVVRELPGRITPTRIAEVRARVSGIIDRRNFDQGSDVTRGEVLYEIDAKPFEIELAAAEAALRKATAALNQESQNAKRKEALAPTGTVSQAQLETAIAAFRQAEADVAAREADVARAKLNLEYTRIRAPIRGRIGRALVTEGALVGQSERRSSSSIPSMPISPNRPPS